MPDILVNNAVVRHVAPVEKFDRQNWFNSLSVNLSAAFHLVQWALPAMKGSEQDLLSQTR